MTDREDVINRLHTENERLYERLAEAHTERDIARTDAERLREERNAQRGRASRLASLNQVNVAQAREDIERLREVGERAYEVLIQVQSPEDWDDLRTALDGLSEGARVPARSAVPVGDADRPLAESVDEIERANRILGRDPERGE